MVWDVSSITLALKYSFHLQMPLFIILSDNVTRTEENFSSSSKGCSQGECFFFGTRCVNKHAKWHDGSEETGNDLATLAACNHTILTYGTFGIWGALLAGCSPDHEVIFPAGCEKTTEIKQIQRANPVGWKVLDCWWSTDRGRFIEWRMLLLHFLRTVVAPCKKHPRKSHFGSCKA